MKLCEKVNKTVGRSLGIPNGRGAFYLGASFCIVLVISWLAVLLFPYGWHQEDSTVWSFAVSLYSFGTTRNEIAIKADQHHPSTNLSGLFDKLDQSDTMWLSVARWEFCRARGGVSQAWCEYFQRLQLASWALMALAFLGVCCLLMGVMAGFCFHFIKPRADLYMWGSAYLLAAPVVFQIGIWQYYFSTYDFGILIGERGCTFGWAFVVAAVLASLTWIPAWVMMSFAFVASTDDESGDEEKLWDSTDSEASYGAMMKTLTEHMAVSASAFPFFSGGIDTPRSEDQEWVTEALDVSSPGPPIEGAPSEAESPSNHERPNFQAESPSSPERPNMSHTASDGDATSF